MSPDSEGPKESNDNTVDFTKAREVISAEKERIEKKMTSFRSFLDYLSQIIPQLSTLFSEHVRLTSMQEVNEVQNTWTTVMLDLEALREARLNDFKELQAQDLHQSSRIKIDSIIKVLESIDFELDMYRDKAEALALAQAFYEQAKVLV